MQKRLGIQNEEQITYDFLAELGKYYAADRVYIFEANAEETFANNSFEWRGKGIASKEENQQSIPLDQLRQWLNRYGDEGAFFSRKWRCRQHMMRQKQQTEQRQISCPICRTISVRR